MVTPDQVKRKNMPKIKIEKPTAEKKKELKIPEQCKSSGLWSVWQCEPSKFDWSYDEAEIAYLYEGKVKVTTKEEKVEINAGDLVTFPKGLDCTWEILKKVRKVYQFV